MMVGPVFVILLCPFAPYFTTIGIINRGGFVSYQTITMLHLADCVVSSYLEDESGSAKLDVSRPSNRAFWPSAPLIFTQAMTVPCSAAMSDTSSARRVRHYRVDRPARRRGDVAGQSLPTGGHGRESPRWTWRYTEVVNNNKRYM